MERFWTWSAVALGFVAVGWSMWGARRPLRPGRVSWMPWAGIMFAGLLAAIFGAIHLLTLAGRR